VALRTYDVHTTIHTHKKKTKKVEKKNNIKIKKEEKGEREEREGGGEMGGRGAWVLRRVGTHTNNARSK